jgi:hypothetical protein
MSATDQTTVEIGPDWVVAEMPPGYQNRVREIQMLMADLEAMGRFGRLLTETGARLGEAVRDVFASLRYETALMADASSTAVVVGLEAGRRLLIHVAGDGQLVQKKSPEISRVFQVLQDVAEENDHVVFVTNAEPDRKPADRGRSVTAEAEGFLSRLGVSQVSALTLFSIWKLSLQEPERAREQVLRLHTHEGGPFELPSYARLAE